MKKNHLITFLLSLLGFGYGNGQNVGIGTSDPKTDLHINGGSSVYTGLILTNTYAGLTYTDGIHLGIQYQSDAPGNRYGYLMIKEDIPFRIGTNNFEAISLTAAGNVGIGYTLPEFKLEVSGSMRMRGSGRRMVFRNSENNADMGSLGVLNDSVISIADNNPSQISRFYFDVENAKLGIGAIPTANDGKVLVSYNSSTSNPQMTVKESSLGDYARFEFANNGAERVWHIAGQNVAGTGQTNLGNDILNIWNSGWGDLMSFRGDGRIGVWTLTPAIGYALSVNGKIVCEELKVQLSESWPDYVFGNDYKLSSLKQVENFIKLNKHLPNIPSAAEIEKNGLSIGEMQKKMMEKIEELTLYIIQQQKEIESLKSTLQK
jgi:hypothetical protein